MPKFPDLLYRIIRALRYYWEARTIYQLHSPFLYQIAKAVIENRKQYYAFGEIEWQRRLAMKRPPQPGSEEGMSMKRIGRQVAVPQSWGRMLFYLAHYWKPRRMLEFGTSIGISGSYLARGWEKGTLCSMEKEASLAGLAQSVWATQGIRGEIRVGSFEQLLPKVLQGYEYLDLVFIDGHHDGAATIQYFEQLLPLVHERTVCIFDDINWSRDMGQAWQKLRVHPRVTLSVDLNRMGWVFFDPVLAQTPNQSLISTRWKPWTRLLAL